MIMISSHCYPDQENGCETLCHLLQQHILTRVIYHDCSILLMQAALHVTLLEIFSLQKVRPYISLCIDASILIIAKCGDAR